MKEFLITVNGNTYEVQVEEVGETPSAAPIPSPKAAPKAVPIPTPETAQKPAAKPLAAGKTAIKCPMPGTIVKVNVNVGDTVKAHTVLCILEAMKMENEIVAGSNGVIASVDTAKGSSVNAGDLLFTMN